MGEQPLNFFAVGEICPAGGPPQEQNTSESESDDSHEDATATRRCSIEKTFYAQTAPSDGFEKGQVVSSKLFGKAARHSPYYIGSFTKVDDSQSAAAVTVSPARSSTVNKAVVNQASRSAERDRPQGGSAAAEEEDVSLSSSAVPAKKDEYLVEFNSNPRNWTYWYESSKYTADTVHAFHIHVFQKLSPHVVGEGCDLSYLGSYRGPSFRIGCMRKMYAPSVPSTTRTKKKKAAGNKAVSVLASPSRASIMIANGTNGSTPLSSSSMSHRPQSSSSSMAVIRKSPRLEATSRTTQTLKAPHTISTETAAKIPMFPRKRAKNIPSGVSSSRLPYYRPGMPHVDQEEVIELTRRRPGSGLLYRPCDHQPSLTKPTNAHASADAIPTNAASRRGKGVIRTAGGGATLAGKGRSPASTYALKRRRSSLDFNEASETDEDDDDCESEDSTEISFLSLDSPAFRWQGGMHGHTDKYAQFTHMGAGSNNCSGTCTGSGIENTTDYWELLPDCGVYSGADSSTSTSTSCAMIAVASVESAASLSFNAPAGSHGDAAAATGAALMTTDTESVEEKHIKLLEQLFPHMNVRMHTKVLRAGADVAFCSSAL